MNDAVPILIVAVTGFVGIKLYRKFGEIRMGFFLLIIIALCILWEVAPI